MKSAPVCDKGPLSPDQARSALDGLRRCDTAMCDRVAEWVRRAKGGERSIYFCSRCATAGVVPANLFHIPHATRLLREAFP